MAALVALKGILVGAIPTFFLVWILYLYITKFFFRPLQETLRKRQEATLGLRQKADAEIAQAEQKAAEYQKAVQAARAELYQLQEKERQGALEKRAEAVRQAHEQAQEMMAKARDEVRAETEAAKKTLASEAEQLAASITRTILRPSAVASREVPS